jgi:hypothetical protein
VDEVLGIRVEPGQLVRPEPELLRRRVQVEAESAPVGGRQLDEARRRQRRRPGVREEVLEGRDQRPVGDDEGVIVDEQ